MGPKQVVNTFTEGMNKDMDKSLVSNRSYLDALNFRLVTTEGGTSGAMENAKGNKQLAQLLDNTSTLTVGKTYYVYGDSITNDGTTYNAGDQFVAGAVNFTGSGYAIEKVKEGQIIIGGVEMRDKVVLFTTNNTSTTPSGGRSCIYEMQIDLVNEQLVEDSLELLYDDNLNDGLNSSDFLNFSIAYPIKAISRYETENLQKVYWTDGYNPVRYAIVSNNLTVSGETYGASNRYQSIDKFNLIPNFDYSKPSIVDIVSGNLYPGMVQYTYQLYTVNGAETAYSPLSDIVHITNSDDFNTTTEEYEGASDPDTPTSKGVKINVNNNNNSGYNRVRLIRVHYASLNAEPTVSVVAEDYINPEGEDIDIVDTGESIETLTDDEIQVTFMERVIAEDIATKDNRLFLANIETDSFSVSGFDSRAVRFRDYTEPASGSETVYVNTIDTNSSVTGSYSDDDTILIEITNWKSWAGIPTSRTITSIDDVVDSNHLEITYTFDGTSYNKVFTSGLTVSDISFTDPDLSFKVNSSSSIFGGSGLPSSIDLLDLASVRYDYSYTAPGTTVYEDAEVVDNVIGVTTIDIPADTSSLSSWNTAGWEDYTTTHDGINYFNDPNFFYDGSKEFIYQSDLSTIGAEGPNIKLSVSTDEFILDEASSADHTYYAGIAADPSNPSYENYASPFLTGQRSWQRGEVYRFFAVYFNERGQASFPQWICDFKMPGLTDTHGSTTYELTETAAGETVAKPLKVTANFRNFPTDAVSAQICAVPREKEDRSIVSQALIVPMTQVTGYYEPRTLDVSTNTVATIVKLVSPEMNINQNLKLGSNDFLQHVGNYSEVTDGSTADERYIHKFQTFTPATKDEENDSGISDLRKVTPSEKDYYYTVGSYDCRNYSDTEEAYSSTGYMVDYSNATWTAEGTTRAMCNYSRNIFDSQYGGHTFEARSRNYCRPVSGLITATNTNFDVTGGDTFINFFDVNTLLFDLTQTGTGSLSEAIYVPVESSINCDLRHDENMHKIRPSTTNYHLVQETAGEWEDSAGNIFTQEEDLYQYNTVYSQQSTLDYYYSKPADWQENNEFDVKIKASEVKVNGELSDSWTQFLVNNIIEVDSFHGPINAIHNFNNSLYYFQDSGVGIVSVNARSLIQDSSGSSLVLGSGGVLDRYDYISTNMGTQDKFSVVTSKSGVYWYDSITGSIYTTNGSNLANLSKAKYIDSYFKNNTDSSYDVRAVHDVVNDEVFFTFMKSSTSDSFTIAYNEIVGAFSSFYSFLPFVYIPFKSKVLSTTTSTYSGVTDSGEFLWSHNSDDVDRSQFYAIDPDGTGSHYDSTVKILFNPDYNYTKVFDAVTIIGSTYSSGTTEVYNKMFDEIRCYDDYQNTDTWNLEYDGTYSGTTKVLPYQRRERSWKTFIPRNAVSANLTTSPDIFSVANLDTTETYKDRMRDKYLITDLTFENDGTYGKFVFSNIGLTYRISYR